jgi:hypothetical protein
MYNTKNYTEQGGDKTVIGGTLAFGPSADVTGLPAASATVRGGVKMAANQAASVEASTPTVAEFNALLTKLKAAGLMVADT